MRSAVVFAGAAAFLQAWTPKFKGINGPAWSLAVEAIFIFCSRGLDQRCESCAVPGFWALQASYTLEGKRRCF
jgi:hypothetical protein